MANVTTADAKLRKDDRRLRMRHNLERLIRQWDQAAKACPKSEQLAVARGHADAWSLLAHWSGGASDKRKARSLQHEVKQETARLAKAKASRLKPKVAKKAAPKVAKKVAKVAPPKVVEVDDDNPKTVAKALSDVLAGIEPDAKPVKRKTTKKPASVAAIVEDFKSENDELVKEDKTKPAVEVEPETQVAIATQPAEAEAPVKPAVVARLKKSTRRASTPRTAELLRIRKVVIDAGHGGKDHGASKRKVREKDVNLAIAKKLGKILRSKYGIKVVYTRTTDKFVSLRRRARIANQSGADLFVSVHANANRRSNIHGIETYYLNTTSNRYAKRLAKRENNLGHDHGDDDPKSWSDESAALPDGELGRDLRLILADLAMRSATVESKRLAGYVQSALVARLRKKYKNVEDLGVKHALFYVLLGSRMPSVLVETGFVTNKDEAKRLADGTYQTQIAQSIAHGIGRFAKERETYVARLASRGEGAASASGLAKASP